MTLFLTETQEFRASLWYYNSQRIPHHGTDTGIRKNRSSACGKSTFRRIATDGESGIIHYGTKFVPVSEFSFFSLRQEDAGFLLKPEPAGPSARSFQAGGPLPNNFFRGGLPPCIKKNAGGVCLERGCLNLG